MDVEKLIEQVELYPVLYDLSDEKYKSSEHSERVWKKIAESLQADGPGACKKKWIHTRDQFRRTLKKRKTIKGTVRKYKYEDKLQFILPQVSDSETLSNIPLVQEEHTEDDPEDSSQETKNSENLFNENDEVKTEISNSNEVNATTIINSPKKESLVKPAPLRRKKIVTRNALDNSPSSQLMSYILEEKKIEKQKEIHPIDAFLNGISHTLKALNPLLLNEAKTKIFEIVQDLERKQILESQSRITTTESLRAPSPSRELSQASASPGDSSAPLPSP